MTYVPCPNSGQSLGQTRDQMRTNTDLLKQSLAVNHVDLGLADVGKHKFVVMPVQSAAPTTLAGEAATYTKDVAGASQVFFVRDNVGASEIQITGPTLLQANNGYCFLPGGLMMQWGVVAAASSSTFVVTFTPAFSVAPYHVSLTGTRAASNPGSTDSWVVAGTLATSGFTIYNSGGHNLGYYWMAIGQA